MATETTTQERTRPAEMEEGGMPAGQSPAVIDQGAAPQQGHKSESQKKKERLNAFMQQIKDRADEFGPLLRARQIDQAVFEAVCRQAIAGEPKILDCEAGSFLLAALACAKDGLLPDKKQAAFVVYNDNKNNRKTVNYQPMYQGLCDIAYRTGEYKAITCQVVYEGEEEFLDFDLGSKPYLSFKPGIDRNDTKPIVGAFAILDTVKGGTIIEVMGSQELRKVATKNKSDTIQKAWPGEMARKGPLRRGLKFGPKSADLNLALAHDDLNYLTDEEEAAATKGGLPDSALLDDEPHLEVAQQQGGAGDDLPAGLRGADGGQSQGKPAPKPRQSRAKAAPAPVQAEPVAEADNDADDRPSAPLEGEVVNQEEEEDGIDHQVEHTTEPADPKLATTSGGTGISLDAYYEAEVDEVYFVPGIGFNEKERRPTFKNGQEFSSVTAKGAAGIPQRRHPGTPGIPKPGQEQAEDKPAETVAGEDDPAEISAGLGDAMVAAIEGADAESLEDIFQNDLKGDPDMWGGLLPADKARVEAAYTARKASFAPEITEFTIQPGGGMKTRTYDSATSWKGQMLLKLAAPPSPNLESWWNGNVVFVRAALRLDEASAKAVLEAAVKRKMPGAAEMLAGG